MPLRTLVLVVGLSIGCAASGHGNGGDAPFADVGGDVATAAPLADSGGARDTSESADTSASPGDVSALDSTDVAEASAADTLEVDIDAAPTCSPELTEPTGANCVPWGAYFACNSACGAYAYNCELGTIPPDAGACRSTPASASIDCCAADVCTAVPGGDAGCAGHVPPLPPHYFRCHTDSSGAPIGAPSSSCIAAGGDGYCCP